MPSGDTRAEGVRSWRGVAAATGLAAVLLGCPALARSEPASQPARQPASQRASRPASRTAPAWPLLLDGTVPAARPVPAETWLPDPLRAERRKARLLAFGATAIPLAAAGMFWLWSAGTHEAAPLYLAGTFGGLGLGFGPGVVHWGLGEYVAPTLRALLRVGLGVGGVAMIAAGTVELAFSGFFGSESPPAWATPLVVAGALMVAAAVGLAIYDIWDAGRAVDRAHARRAIVVTPYASRLAGAPHCGLVLAGAF